MQDADAIWREEIAKAGLDKEISQYYAALTNMHSVGVMGDERTYDYAIALRAVTTTDFMTAEVTILPNGDHHHRRQPHRERGQEHQPRHVRLHHKTAGND